MNVSVREEVVVTGEAPVIDTTKATVGTTNSAEQISKLPLARNFSSIAFRAPGTGTDNAGGATVYGATSLENQYIIDGVNTSAIKGYSLGTNAGNQGKTLNQEFVQEVEVKTGGYEAEYGRALGGTINVVTKSGGNEFHGDAFGYDDPKNVAAADARQAARASAGLASLAVANRTDFGADLGGYFMKDRIWFFAAYDRVKSDQDFTRQLTGRAADGTPCGLSCPQSGGTTGTTSDLFSGKLTFRLGEANTVAVAAFGDPSRTNNVVRAVIGPDAAALGARDFGGTDLSAKYDGLFGTSFLAQAQFGYHDEKNKIAAANSAFADPVAAPDFIRQQTGFLTERYSNSGFGTATDENYKRYAYKGAASYFVGANEIKGGVDYEDIKSSFATNTQGITRRFTSAGVERSTANRYYAQVPLGLNCLQRANGTVPKAGETVQIPDCIGWAVGQDFSNPHTQNLGAFLQDSIKIGRNLTVNAGIRYEQQKVIGTEASNTFRLKDEWSPRLGIIWDPLSNGRSKLFGSYGRFYTTVPQDLQTRSLGREATIILYNAYTTNKINPIGTAGIGFAQTGDLINPDGLKGMYQDEIIAGVEFELIKSWSFGLKGIYKSLGRVLEDRCDIPYNADLSQILASNDPFIQNYQPTCALINVGGNGLLNTIKDPADKTCYPNGATTPDGTYAASSPCASTRAVRKYRGIQVDVTHRFASNFFVQASYVYSKLEGNYSGNLSQTREGGQFDPNINADFDYPGLVTNSYGRLRNDAPHQAKLTGYYSFPFGLTTGMNFTFQSGRPVNLIGCPEDYVACASGYSLEGYIVPKGSYGRMPSYFEGDVHLEYALRLGRVSITPIIDVFNVLNRQGVISNDDVYNNQGDAALNVPCTDANTGQKGYFGSCAPNANFGKPIQWQAPRSVRFGARVSF